MDGHAQEAVAGTARAALRAGAALAGLALALASGCAGVEQLVTNLAAADKPTSPVTRVVAVWGDSIVHGVDPVHGAAPMYGLAGRVYLYPADMKQNLLADGRLVVELYAPQPGQPQAPPVKLETWEIKKDILNSVSLRTDVYGAGYSLSLPWPSYRPDITQVLMQVRYEPEKGLPVYSHSQVALNNGPIAPPVVSNRVETGNGQPVAAVPPPGVAQPSRAVMGPPAGAAPFPNGFQPVGGMPMPGGVQPAVGTQPQVGGMPMPGGVQPAVGAQPQVGAAPAAGQYAPACVVQPAGPMPPAAAAPYPAAPPPYQVQQPAGAFPR